MHFDKMYTFVECTLFSPKEGAEILIFTFKNDTYLFVCIRNPCMHMSTRLEEGWTPGTEATNSSELSGVGS